jgi:hypothetical protein
MQFVRTPEGMITVAAFFLAVLLAAFLISRYLKKTADARLIKKIFARHCEAIEADAVLPDGLDGFMFVDYLLLLRGKIIALNVLSKKGVVLCLTGDEWTCIENNRSEKFGNPLASLQQSVQQMRHELDFKPIDACVLFGSMSRFPKGAPTGVWQINDLDQELSRYKGKESAQDQARNIWEKLIGMNHQARLKLEYELKS